MGVGVGTKGFPTFIKGIISKVNITAWLKSVIKCLPYVKGYFIDACSFSTFNFFFQYCIKFFLRKLSKFDVLLVVNIFFSRLISEEFPSRFFLCSFDSWILSSWLAAFSFTPEMMFFPLPSFTVCQANHDCLSSTEFLISLIWFWMYFNFFGTFFAYLWTFLSFCSLALVRFLFFKVRMLLHDIPFFSNCCWLSCYFYMGGNKVFQIHHLEDIFQMSLGEYQTSFLHLHHNWQMRISHLVKLYLLDSYFYVNSGKSLLRLFDDPKIHSFKWGVCLTVQSTA